jgi:hypothetical protein
LPKNQNSVLPIITQCSLIEKKVSPTPPSPKQEIHEKSAPRKEPIKLETKHDTDIKIEEVEQVNT